MVGGLALVVVVFLGWQLQQTRSDLEQAQDTARSLKQSLADGNADRAGRQAGALEASASSAHDRMTQPQWRALGAVPFLGDTVDALRKVSEAADVVATRAVPPLVEIAQDFSAKAFTPSEGKVDVDAIAGLAPQVASASQGLDAAEKLLDSAAEGSLLSAVRGPVDDARSTVRSAATTASRASVASRVLPDMLQGEKKYLLVFQNNAEIRATGGLPGAWAVLDVKDGAVELGEQGSAAGLGDLARAADKLTPEELKVFDDQPATDFRDVNIIPDWPRAAELAAAIMKQEKDLDLDGVLALDPVTLGYLLKGSGGVTLAKGVPLTSENATQLLLNKVYLTFRSNEKQDAFFADAARRVFEKLISTGNGTDNVVRGLVRAGREHRVLVWSRDQQVAEALQGTAVAGELSGGRTGRTPVGVYFNDATGAKMQYYFGARSRVTGRCVDGKGNLRLTVTLKSRAPQDSSFLPESIQGPGFGADPGTMLVNTYLYGPAGGSVTNVEIDGEPTTAFPGTHQDRPLQTVTVQLDPGSTVVVTATVKVPKPADGEVELSQTPTIEQRNASSTAPAPCA
ncbi:hypothetical protein ASD11_14055 [Aeromicrobium sp. Root495]|uniref:DUF4012 domain-containing protein n=1 Tax=Aeromicrobium sp. Root495 TaxID=1736550 RepID=UPI0006FFD8BB|nr:DUF4012 domain-containing protein [Aeromicrobium sp. Root495]KQY60556.1 hypothetical protein ASD11_14055 [Aeromicrobium sp. Root495]